LGFRWDHVAINVRDAERSKQLYCGILGCRPFFETVLDLPDISRIVFLEKDASRIELVEMRSGADATVPASAVTGLAHLCFDVDDMDEGVQRLSAAGLKVVLAPMYGKVKVPSEENWRRTVFRGLDGELIELRGP